MKRLRGRWDGLDPRPPDPLFSGPGLTDEAAEDWVEERSVPEIRAYNKRANALGVRGIGQTPPSERRLTAARKTPLRGSSPGELIREARLRAFLTQKDLATIIGSSQAEISRWETGKRVPSFSVILRVVGATGHDLELALKPTASVGDDHRPAMTILPAERLLPYDQFMARRSRRRKEFRAELRWSRVGPQVPR